MNLFWLNKNENVEITYDTLYSDLTKSGYNNNFIQYENPYDIFLNLIRNLLSEKQSIILDSDFSSEELLFLDIKKVDIEESQYFQSDKSNQFNTIEDIIQFIIDKKNELGIEIFTSGTTGKPKKIFQSFKNIIREVKIAPHFSQNIWGFAYNPTHFAGLQVFFQAFLNKNPLIFVFTTKYEQIYESLVQYKVTHLSCTPTYMKLLLPNIKKPILTISSLTFGGEKFDKRIESKIKNKFPNAVIKNVYASTEAGSLFRTDGEYFAIPEKYAPFVKIKENEILIHKKLIGASSFLILDGDWYKTGDLIEYVDGEKFRFQSRKSEILNVGGYNVNPFEIEEIIKSVEGVKDASVFGKKNSITGNIMIANVIKMDNVDEGFLKTKIKSVINEKLQDYKRPRIIKFVNYFELTRTGKQKK